SKIDHLGAAHRNIWLVTILVPEQPLVPLGCGKAIARDEIAAAGQIANDGVGLRQRAAIVEFDHGHLSRAVELEELRSSAFALENIDRNPAVGQRKPVADPFHLQAVARLEIAVDFHPVALGGTTEQQAASMMSIMQLQPCAGFAASEPVADAQ